MAITSGDPSTVTLSPQSKTDMMHHAHVMLQNIGQISEILNVVAIVMGIALVLGGIFQLKRYGEMRTQMSQQMSLFGPLATLMAGAFLLILPYTVTTALRAFWGPGQTMPIAYHGASTHNVEVYIPVVLAFVRLIGVGAIIRALTLFSKAGSQGAQPGTMGKAIAHLIGGILCVHVMGTVDLVRYIFDV